MGNKFSEIFLNWITAFEQEEASGNKGKNGDNPIIFQTQKRITDRQLNIRCWIT